MKMDVHERYEELTGEMSRLERKVKLMSQIVLNINRTRLLTDAELRIYLNNVEYTGNFVALPLSIKSLGPDEMYAYIGRLARVGDPLAKAIKEYCQDQYLSHLFGPRAMEHSEIPEKLLLRTMTEKEYDSYLSGEKPFSTWKEDRFLSQKVEIK